MSSEQNLGLGSKTSVEKQELEGRKIEIGDRKIEIEARKIEIDARKIGDQKRLTCQKHKVKERNVANNYENLISFLSEIGTENSTMKYQVEY